MASLLNTLLNNMVHGRNEKNGPTKVETVNNPVPKRSLQSKDNYNLINYAIYNSSYSGCDMVATLNMTTYTGETISVVLGELQTLSYSIHNEKAPVRNLGSVNAVDYVTGPRTIAGSLVFAVFNQHWAANLMEEMEKRNIMKDANRDYVTDSIPPFDIVCSMANEYGFQSYLVLSGVRVMNEGQVMSTQDIFIENTYQYVATDIRLLKASVKPYVWQTDRRVTLVPANGPFVLTSKNNGKDIIGGYEGTGKDKVLFPIEFKDNPPGIPIVNETIKP